MAVAPDRLKFVEGDIFDLETDTRLLRECDAVVHFAAETFVEASTQHPLLFWQTNADGSLHLLEAARLAGKLKRFILVSSVEVYGSCHIQNRPWRETDLINPPTPYAAAKAAAENAAAAYWQSYGIPVVITRSSNNYGLRQHPEKQLPAFLSAALQGQPLRVDGDGGHLRQWLYVEDHCRALDLLLHADASDVVGEIFNIGSGPGGERSTLENARAVLGQLDLAREMAFGPDRQPSIRRLAVDSTKLERLGWKPQVSFEEGLARTLAYYHEQFPYAPQPGVRLAAAEPMLAQA